MNKTSSNADSKLLKGIVVMLGALLWLFFAILKGLMKTTKSIIK